MAQRLMNAYKEARLTQRNADDANAPALLGLNRMGSWLRQKRC